MREIRAEGVQAIALRDPEAPTSLMVKEHRTSTDTRIWYYRHDNAGSKLNASDIDPALIRDAALLQSPASLRRSPPGCPRQSTGPLHRARCRRDRLLRPQFRGRLWTREAAKMAYLRLIPQADIVFAGDDEAAIAVGSADAPLELAHRLVGLGAGQAIIKLGSRGAVAVVDGSEYERHAIPVDAIDTVGAGDAFVAGYLAEYVAGTDVPTRLTTAVTVGAYACLSPGDWEGLPHRAELAMLGGSEPVSR